MDYEKLKEVIAKQIKENGKREITGPVLQAVLMAMVDSLGEVYPHTYTDEEKAQARANIDALSNHNGEITKEKLSLEVQAILNDVANKQNISDATLATIAKTIVGAINEVYKGGLEDASIATSKIKDGAVTDAKIANGAVTTEKVNDGAITEPKLDTDLVNIITSAVQPAELASAIATALASYVAKSDIVDTTGSATDKVMSQHGVTEAINGVTNKVTELELGTNAEILKLKNGKMDALLSVNLFNKDSEDNMHGYYISASTYIQDDNYKITHPIYVEQGKTYKCVHHSSLGTNYYCARCDETGKLIKILLMQQSDGFQIITPDFTGYIRFNIGSLPIDAFMVCLSDDYPSSYVGYYKRTGLGYLLNDEQISEVNELIKEYVRDIPNYFIPSVNLFNKDDERNINGYYKGTLVSSTNYILTHPIKIEKGITYKMPKKSEMGGNANKVAVCDKEGNIIKSAIATINENFILYTAEDDGFARFNAGYKSKIDTFMVCKENEYPSEFIPFGDTLVDVRIPSSSIMAININPLYGKKLSVDGDSICAGAGYKGGYAKIIGERNNMTVQNLAVGGGTLATETYSSNGSARHWISSSMDSLSEDADYIIIEGGLNDAESLGVITDGYDSSLDQTTFCGASETICKKLISKFHGKKYGFIIAHRYGGFNYAIEGGRVQLLIQIFEKWGIPYLDLNRLLPDFQKLYNSTIPELKLVSTTYFVDSEHPNEQGYNKYFCDKIEEWMKSL